MSAFVGQISATIVPSQTLNGSTGRIIAINNNSAAMLYSVRVLLTTTATVGNRQLTLRVQDGAGHNIAGGIAVGNLAASSPFDVTYGAGLTTTAIANFQTMSIPVNLIIPGLSQIQLFDNANIDANDTIAVNIWYAY